jgi:hypothetical protein
MACRRTESGQRRAAHGARGQRPPRALSRRRLPALAALLLAACAGGDPPQAGDGTAEEAAASEAAASAGQARGASTADGSSSDDARQRSADAELWVVRDRRGEATAAELSALALYAVEETAAGRAFLALGADGAAVLAAAEDAAVRSGDVDLAAYVADERARTLQSTGRVTEALAVLDAALSRPVVDAGRTLPLELLAADVALDLGRYERVEAALANAERTLAALGPRWPHHGQFEAALFGARARSAQAQGRPDEAAAALGRALDRALTDGAASAVAALEVERANLWLSADRPELLHEQVTAALARPELAEQPAARGALELCSATAAVVRSRIDPALRDGARDALRQLRGRSSLTAIDRLRVELRLTEVELLRGDLDAAEAALAQAGAELDSRPPGTARFEATLWQLNAARLERRRCALAPEPARRSALAALAAQLEREHRSWAEEVRAAPLHPGGSGTLQFGERRGLASEWVQVLLELEGPERGAQLALGVAAQLQALGSRHRQRPWPALDGLDATRLRLQPGEGLLCYLPAIYGSHLILLDGDGARHFDLPAVGELNRRRVAFDAVFDPAAAAQVWTSAAAELRQGLLPEAALEHVLRWRAVSIVGLDLLRYVPFEWLPLPDGRRLGAALAVGYWPDLPTALRLAEHPPPARATAPLDLAWVAAPALEWPELDPWPARAADPQVLGRGCAPDRLRGVSGARADLAAVEAAAHSGARILHLLTHGVAADDGSGTTGLALAGGPQARLCARDVERWTAVPPLVVLSACRAARGPGRLGEGGLEGLVGALLEAGARCVLVAYVDVELEALLTLLDTLQPRLLEGGESPAAALAAAQAAVAERWPERPAAALLHAVGEAHRPLPPR